MNVTLHRRCSRIYVPWTKPAPPKVAGYSKRGTVDTYSRENLLVCGAQFARTHNTVVFLRTRKPRSVERQTKPAVIFGYWHKRTHLQDAALFARERLIGADTAHSVRGYAPFGGAAQFER